MPPDDNAPSPDGETSLHGAQSLDAAPPPSTTSAAARPEGAAPLPELEGTRQGGARQGGGRLRRLLRLATIDARPLRRRDFRLLFVGQLVSFFGTMITLVALPY